MKKPISICLYILLILFTLPSNSEAKPETSPTILNEDELHKMIEDGADLLVIDTRSAELFKEGHIPGSVNLPAANVNAETLAELADDPNKKLVFYCDDDGAASRISAAKAIGAGYKYVYQVSGGYSLWKKQGYKATKPQL